VNLWGGFKSIGRTFKKGANGLKNAANKAASGIKDATGKTINAFK